MRTRHLATPKGSTTNDSPFNIYILFYFYPVAVTMRLLPALPGGKGQPALPFCVTNNMGEHDGGAVHRELERLHH